jgi:hypothetical protein
MEATEGQIHEACVEWLELVAPENFIFFHPANGEPRHPAVAARLKRMGVKPGVSDLVFVWDGQVLFVEIKSGKGRQSLAQKDFERRVSLAGFAYVLVRSLDEFRLAVGTFISPAVTA